MSWVWFAVGYLVVAVALAGWLWDELIRDDDIDWWCTPLVVRLLALAVVAAAWPVLGGAVVWELWRARDEWR